jgi:hypothetical protein
VPDSRETTLSSSDRSDFILAAVVGDLPYPASARTLEMSHSDIEQFVRGVFARTGLAREIGGAFLSAG